MSPLTKIFVGLLIVLSLVLSAASVTFLSTVPSYGTQVTSLEQQLEIANSTNATVTSQSAAKVSALNEQIANLKSGANTTEQSLIEARAERANAQAQVATLQAQLTAAQTTTSGAIAAYNANQAVIETLQTQIAALNQENVDAYEEATSANAELVTLQNEYEYLRRANKRLEEQAVAMNAQLEDAYNVMAEAGLRPSTEGLAGTPRINGVITGRQQLTNGTFASISVGREDDVRVGMQFSVFDGDDQSFLGFIDITGVDDNEAFGKLSGPAVGRIDSGDVARTRLDS